MLFKSNYFKENFEKAQYDKDTWLYLSLEDKFILLHILNKIMSIDTIT